MDNKLKIIKIRVEQSNTEESFCMYFNDYYFYAVNKTNEDINSILKGLNIKQYKNEGSISKNIDVKDLIEKLKVYEICKIESDTSCYYEIGEFSDYAKYEECQE